MLYFNLVMLESYICIAVVKRLLLDNPRGFYPANRQLEYVSF